MPAIITVALNNLEADPMNVRKTNSADGIEQLAASIAANGVLQNLVVRKGKKDRYLVVAGGRRLRALTVLAETGRIAAAFRSPAPCGKRKKRPNSVLPRTSCARR